VIRVRIPDGLDADEIAERLRSRYRVMPRDGAPARTGPAPRPSRARPADDLLVGLAALGASLADLGTRREPATPWARAVEV
jgi:hypothetical protein